jgi:hypothetical protein
MISYDDLVVALTAWRARQGLPVGHPAAVAAAAAPPPPARKPVAPPRPAPSRAAAPASEGDFEDGGLIEDAGYDTSDEDYVMQLGGEQPAEPTAIGAAPEPPPGKRGKRDRW